MQLLNPPLSCYVDLLGQGQPFALSRYGDGEWAWILDIDHTNEEGHRYFPEMASDLRLSLEHAHPLPFYYAMPKVERLQHPERVERYSEGLPIAWYDCNILARHNVRGELYPLVEALRERRMVYVGPKHLLVFAHKQLNCEDYRIIPASNAYAVKDMALEVIRKLIVKEKPDVIGFSAGPLTNILIDVLWDGSTTLIDFGSIWDAYVGVKSRAYMNNDLSEQFKKNLGEQ